MSDSEARLRAALGRVAAGAPLDEALRAITEAVTERFGALSVKVWLVKTGDVCATCSLAQTCENRDMCLHLKAWTGGASEPARVPLVVFRDRVTSRGGGARIAESTAGALLFGRERDLHSGADAFATIPLKGPTGVLGLIGMLATEPVSLSDLDALRGYADTAAVAIRIADLSSRCQRASLRIEEAAGERAEVGGLLHAILYGSTEYNVIAEDLDGRVTVFSEGARVAYGYEPDEIIGKVKADVLYAPEELEGRKVVEILNEAMETGRAEAVVARLRKNGERFPARATFTVRRDEDGDPCGFVVVERDLTRERTSARLTETATVQLVRTQEHLRDLRAAHVLLEDTVSAVRAENAGLRRDAARADSLEAALAEMRRALDESEGARASAEAQNIEAVTRAILLEGERDQFEARARRFEEEASALRVRVEEDALVMAELREQFAALRALRRKLELRLESAAAREVTLSAELAAARHETARAAAAVAALSAERDDLAHGEARWDQERNMLVAERERLLAARDNRIAELEALAASLEGAPADELVIELDAAQRRVEETEARLDTLAGERRVLEERLRAAEMARAALEVEKEAAAAARARLDDTVAELSDRAAQTAARARARDLEVESLRRRLESAEHSAHSRAEVSAAEVAALHDVVKALGEKCATLDAQLEAARAGVEPAARDEIERLARAHEVKSRLLADMSHELRSPMNAIIGYTALVLDDAASVPERHVETLRKVERNARDLLQLINNVLDLSKLEVGRMEVFPEPVDLAELASSARSTVEPLVGDRQLELLLEVSPDASRLVTDRTKLQQILVNLLTNAVKFTPFGKVRVRATAVGECVQVSVEDTGVGIAPEDLDVIFEEYRQVGRSSGTGLGLPIARRLARLLGGELTVESRPGWGSTFTLRVPRALAGGPTGSAERTALEAGAVLVLAPDPNEAFLIGKYLREADLGVVVAEEVDHAAELAATCAPRSAVVDIATDGAWDVIGTLTGRGAAVVAIGPASERGRAFARGARAFVARPVERRELVRALERSAAGARPRVLVIDDEEDARDLMARMLAKGELDVEVASSGAAALERVAARRPDLVVLDLMMPQMDGFEMVHQLTSRPEWRDIPILLVTAKDLTPAERRALGPSVRRVMRKGDLNRDEILAEIDRAVNVQ